MLLNKCYIFFYQCAIQLYGSIIWLLAPFNLKAKLWVKGRKDIFRQLKQAFSNNKSAVIWIHCSSLGEFEQGRPIIEFLKKEYPHYKILLTFYSSSGFEIRKNYPLADYIFYLPIDSPKNARRFISITKPQKAIFVKYDFWYFYLKALQDHSIPTYLIAGVFRKNHFLFKSYGKWLLNTIAGFEILFLQDNNSLKIIEQKGLKNGIVVGDPRIDRVGAIAKAPSPIPEIKQFKNEKKLFIFGSTHPKDEQLFWKFLDSLFTKNYLEDWKFLLVPHEVDSANIKRIMQSTTHSSIRFTEIVKTTNLEAPTLLILDTIGKLSTAYQYGDLCYIGGGFDKSIHNILEPAAFGLPIIFGPNYQQFIEGNDLVNLGGAFSIKSVVELLAVFDKMTEIQNRKIKGGICKQYILDNIGVTEKIMDRLDQQHPPSTHNK